MDRCPICEVAVKPENLLRHLNDIHPRHPDTPGIRERLKEEPGRIPRRKAAPPIRVRRWQVALVTVVVLSGVGVVYLAGILASPPAFPCISVEGGARYHWHVDLTILSGTTPVTIPGNIGLSLGCTQPLHTHNVGGQIHVESDTDRLYSIGDFFTLWRKSFGSPTQMFVNGTAVSVSSNVILYDTETIELHYVSFMP